MNPCFSCIHLCLYTSVYLCILLTNWQEWNNRIFYSVEYPINVIKQSLLSSVFKWMVILGNTPFYFWIACVLLWFFFLGQCFIMYSLWMIYIFNYIKKGTRVVLLIALEWILLVIKKLKEESPEVHWVCTEVLLKDSSKAQLLNKI